MNKRQIVTETGRVVQVDEVKFQGIGPRSDIAKEIRKASAKANPLPEYEFKDLEQRVFRNVRSSYPPKR